MNQEKGAKMPETNGNQADAVISRRDCVKMMGGLALMLGAGGALSAGSGQTPEQADAETPEPPSTSSPGTLSR